MKLALADICRYGECNVSSRNFVEGEKFLNSKFILHCAKMPSTNDNTID